MLLLSTILIILALLIAGMALLIGAVMVIDPGTIESGVVLFVLLAALAGACFAIGRRLRREVEAAQDSNEETYT